MKISEYQKLAIRTMADLGSRKANGVHMALGIMSEMGELMVAGRVEDLTNIIEEHGDMNWFIAGTCELYGLSYEELYEKAKPSTKTKHIINIFKIPDLHKAEFAYSREMDVKKLKKSLRSAISWLKNISQEEDFQYLDSLTKNIEKLKKRYPEKFTEENANNRDLEGEREVLEQ